MNRRKGGRNTAQFNLANSQFGGKDHDHIAARRLTIRPGFLNRAIVSDTVQKAKQSETPINNREHRGENIPNMSLHSFFRENRNLRRSERLLKKHFVNNNFTSPNKSYSEYRKPSATPPRTQSAVLIPQQKPKGNGIVRNTSKSIFKEINEKYASAENLNLTQNKEMSRRFAENQEFNLNFNGIIDEPQNLVLLENKCSQNKEDNTVQNLAEQNDFMSNFQGFTDKPEINNNFGHDQEAEHFKKPYSLLNLDKPINKSFCKETQRQIPVKLKRNERIDVFRRTNEEIEKTHLVVAGKLQYTDAYSSEKYQPDKPRARDDDEDTETFTPFPRHCWSFRTPPRQTLHAPPVEESHLQTGVLSLNDFECNLYEFQPHENIEHPNIVPLDNRFLNRLGQAKRKHLENFQFGGNNVQAGSNYYLENACHNQVPLNFYNGTNNGYTKYPYPGFPEVGAECPAYYTSRPYKKNFETPRRPVQIEENGGFKVQEATDKRQKIDNPYINQKNIETPRPMQNLCENDITFIEENGGFKVQETMRDKRQKIDDFYIDQKSTGVSANFFNFNQIENRETDKNLFNFNEVRM